MSRSLLIAALFLAARVPLLLFRQPFYDELFTHWIAAKPFGGILTALHYDSGPPLYYFLVHLLGNPSITGTRVLSLVFSTIALAALLIERHHAPALLLAVSPPAVLFAADARAYAMCAMFVTLGILALDREKRWAATAVFVLAAYSHYYGVLFFPLLLTRRRGEHGETPLRVSASPRELLVALVAFAPGIWLALHQPRASMAWMQSFTYPDALWARPPLLLAIAVVALMVAAAWPFNRYTLMTVVPWLLALPIYVPLRFESVIATPLALWLGTKRRAIVIAPLAVALAMVVALGILEHRSRPFDDYRDVAMRVVSAREPVVASGYLYLETISVRDAVAFPAEQAQHPGWRVAATSGSELPSGTFLWVGERAAPELAILRRSRSVQPLYINDRAMIARVR